MARPEDADLSPTSRRWLADTPLAERKGRGQYLTPRRVAEALVDRISLKPGMRVLDPGVGTGELLAAVARRCPRARLTGWDIDPTVLAAAGELVPEATLELRSALDRPDPETDAAGPEDGFDLVIGNPPYFQVPVTPELKARFGSVISGRANVFALFFKAGLDLLAPGGTLAFIVPPSMNSGAYFEALREHIVARASISDLTLLEGSSLFEGANTAAQLLILSKDGDPVSRFVFEHSEPEAGFRRVVFTESPDRLRRGFEGRRTLWQLGYEAVTGTVVWNQRRRELSPTAGAGTVPLVWSRDLCGGIFEPGADRDRSGRPDSGNRDRRPGHILSRRRLTGPALLVNRVVGAVGRGELRTLLVPEGAEFLAENHVNVVRRRPGAPSVIGWQDLQRSLASGAAADRVRMLTGNTQISARELTHLLPL